MKSTRIAGVGLAGAILFSSFALVAIASSSFAATPTQDQAMAACRAKYGKKVVNAIVNKNGSLTCQWQVVREMTRTEAYESCRKKFGPTTIFVQKKKGGWVCRYKPRTSF
jgi:hypothetical protein